MSFFKSKIKSKTPIIFTCEHASPKIPKKYKNLGLSLSLLKKSKDLYDPGAFDLFNLLVKSFDSSYIYSNISRLIIDVNRNLHSEFNNLNTYHSGLIKKQILVEIENKEFLIDIPYNQNLSLKKEKELYQKICLPYQEKIKDQVLYLLNIFPKVFIFSIHSMYYKYNNKLRSIEIDLIGDNKNIFFKKISQILKQENKKLNNSYKVGINKPWSFEDVNYGAFHEVIRIPNVEVCAFEIRNDLLLSQKKIKEIFKFIKNVIKKSVNS